MWAHLLGYQLKLFKHYKKKNDKKQKIDTNGYNEKLERYVRPTPIFSKAFFIQGNEAIKMSFVVNNDGNIDIILLQLQNQ